MEKVLTFTLALAVSLATTAMLAASHNGVPRSRGADAQTATDGAFRDGLYVGRLAAEDGRPDLPQVGRWSNVGDRASFVAGYRRGYNAVPARATTDSPGSSR